MPTTQSDYQAIEEARKKQGALNAEAGNLSAQANTFSDEIMAKVREDRASRGADKLATSMGTTTAQLSTRPAEIRNRLADVNPLQTDVITSRETGMLQGALATDAALAKSREQTISEPIQAYTNQLLAKAEIKKAEAEQADQEARTLIEQLQLKMDRERLDLQKQTSGGGGKQSPIEMLMALQGGGQPTEPKPQYSPQSNGAVSPGGQWKFQDTDWIPAGGGSQVQPQFDEQTLTMAMLADPSNASTYKYLLDKMNKTPEVNNERQIVSGVVDQLKLIYDENNLAKGRLGGLFTGASAAVGKNAGAKNYNDLRNGIVSTLKGLVGESGVLTDNDTERLKGLLPEINATPEEAAGSWENVFNFIENKYQSQNGDRPPLSSFDK